MKIVVECTPKEMADFILALSQPDRHIDEKINSVFEKLIKKQPAIVNI